MTREEFHRAYEQTPEGFKAELIGGIVYVASRLRRPHATYHLALGSVFFTYKANTPGVESGDNATLVLGEDAEPPQTGGRLVRRLGRSASGDLR